MSLPSSQGGVGGDTWQMQFNLWLLRPAVVFDKLTGGSGGGAGGACQVVGVLGAGEAAWRGEVGRCLCAGGRVAGLAGGGVVRWVRVTWRAGGWVGGLS
jgi:hypothetical protein